MSYIYIWSPAARLLRSWVRIPSGAWIFVCCVCRVLSGRGLCDKLITRPEESYRLCCVVVCDLETSRIGAPYIYDISSLRVNDNHPLTTTHMFSTWGNPIHTKWSLQCTAHSCKPHLKYGVLPPRYNDHELTTTTPSGNHRIMNTVHGQHGQPSTQGH